MEYISSAERNLGITQEPWGLALNELDQAGQTGRDVTALRTRLAETAPTDDEALLSVYEQTLALESSAEWATRYREPEGREAIVTTLDAEKPAAPPRDVSDQLLGGWVGRIIGNVMGKPFEIGTTREGIRAYLQGIDSYPLRGYVPFADGADRSQLGQWGFEGVTEGRIDGAIRDDDLDYTVFALGLVETYGVDYSTRDVAFEWLSRFPAYQVFTAERCAYQNLVREVPLDEAGEFHNPFREWIGALIRADLFGFIYPGRPRRAALATVNDAYLSHRANGVYGEMWSAALISSAFSAATPLESVRISLEHIPPRSRLAEEVSAVIADFERGLCHDAALDAVFARHPGMSWVHTINNAGALTAAILWGGGDFATTAGFAVIAGLDTDSIGATAGAWAGVFGGARAIPASLVDPLHDRYDSGVFGVGSVSISVLAERTLALVSQLN